jgi:ankyrin repeat protein
MLKGNQSAIFEAVKAGDIDAVRALLDANPALVNARTDSGMTPIVTATYWGRREVADVLIASGAEVDLHTAAALGMTQRVGDLLEAAPALIDRHSPDGWTALALSAYFGQAEVARLLLELGADLNVYSTNDNANQPLHAAIAGKRPELVSLLLTAGADVNARAGGGWTPVNLASHEGPASIVAQLLDAGADPSIPNDEGRTPLATAIHERQPEVEELLRSRGVDA